MFKLTETMRVDTPQDRARIIELLGVNSNGGTRGTAENDEALVGLRHGFGAAIGWGAYILPFDWMQKAGLAGTVIGFVIGGLMIAIIGLSYGFTIRALPLTGGGVAVAMAALSRTHAFIAGWALTLGVLVRRRVERVGGHAYLPCHVP